MNTRETKKNIQALLDGACKTLKKMEKATTRTWVALSDYVLKLAPLIPEPSAPYNVLFALVCLCQTSHVSGNLNVVMRDAKKYNPNSSRQPLTDF